MLFKQVYDNSKLYGGRRQTKKIIIKKKKETWKSTTLNIQIIILYVYTDCREKIYN